MPNQPIPIDYARPARRRWRRGRLLLLAIVALALGAGLYWRERIAHEARLWNWQRQCLNYTRPPGTPTATSQPSAANDRDYDSPSAKTQQVLNPPSERWLMPACLMHFDNERSGGSIHRIPQTLFLHERISPGGHRRLVVVESIMQNALAITMGLVPRVIAPGTPWSPARELPDLKLRNFSGHFIEAQFYFGQVDRSDASHFTIDFAVKDSGSHGTIDAWLQDDDSVIFKLRNHPEGGW